MTTKLPSTEQRGRSGVIEEVLGQEPHPRYRIRWDDGHQSIYTPQAGTLTVEPAAPKRRRAARPARKSR